MTHNALMLLLCVVASLPVVHPSGGSYIYEALLGVSTATETHLLARTAQTCTPQRKLASSKTLARSERSGQFHILTGVVPKKGGACESMRLSPCVLVQPDGWARGEREGYGEPCDVTSLSLKGNGCGSNQLFTRASAAARSARLRLRLVTSQGSPTPPAPPGTLC